MAGENKRPAVKARKANAATAKGARRRARAGNTGNGQRLNDGKAYGNRSITRTNAQGISITVQIPPLRRPKPEPKRAAGQDVSVRHRRRWPVVVLSVFVVAAAVGFYFTQQHTVKPVAEKPAAATKKTAPEYQPLVPSAAKASASTFDGQRDLVTYNTNFNDARITVSEQAVPASFSKNPDSLKHAADSINATHLITSDKGPIYIATNEDAGDQRAIYADSKVLVFVHADRKLDDTSWKLFIGLLEAKSWNDLENQR